MPTSVPSSRLSRRRGAGLLAWMLVFILGCMGCCCGGLPLFGIWPSLDPSPVEAALEGQPLVVDHACRADVSCAAVVDVEAELLPLSYGLLSGELVVLVDVQARCLEREEDDRAAAVVCMGVVAAVYEAGESGWELRYVTESTAGMESSGLPYTGGGGGGGDWDD